MEILYKYSKYFGIESLINPAIRLSPAKTLNDPFEYPFNAEVKKSIQEMKFKGVGNSVMTNKLITYEGQRLVAVSKTLLGRYGIVSLTKTPCNILMWAHYANEHNGICIGYKNNLFESLPDKIPNDTTNIERYTPCLLIRS